MTWEVVSFVYSAKTFPLTDHDFFTFSSLCVSSFRGQVFLDNKWRSNQLTFGLHYGMIVNSSSEFTNYASWVRLCFGEGTNSVTCINVIWIKLDAKLFREEWDQQLQCLNWTLLFTCVLYTVYSDRVGPTMLF